MWRCVMASRVPAVVVSCPSCTSVQDYGHLVRCRVCAELVERAVGLRDGDYPGVRWHFEREVSRGRGRSPVQVARALWWASPGRQGMVGDVDDFVRTCCAAAARWGSLWGADTRGVTEEILAEQFWPSDSEGQVVTGGGRLGA